MIKLESWLVELVRGLGTPHFIFDLHVVRRQIRMLKKLFPSVSLYYSTKTNSALPILDCAKHEGMRFEAATLGEIELLIGRGIAAKEIFYTHPVKTVSEIRQAYKLGVRLFTTDSLQELVELDVYAPKAGIMVRLDPRRSASLYDYKRRLGAEISEIGEILNYAVRHKSNVQGISFHVGSQSMKVYPWVKALKQGRAIVKKYYKKIPSLRLIDFGSGFPVDYGFGKPPTMEAVARAINKELVKFPKGISFTAEPGRIIVAPAAVLVTSVVDNIRRGKINWIFTDVTVYSGPIERIESGGRFSYPISDAKSGPSKIYNVAGKTLDPDDILATGVRLSANLKSGDLLFLRKAGAYTLEFFTNYHSLPKPLVTFHDSEYEEKVKIAFSTLSNRGVITKRNIKRGETIFTVTGHHSPKRTRTSFQIGLDAHTEPTVFGAYLNHSCGPNAGVRTNGHGLLDVVAMRDIKKGKEVTVDYAMFETEAEFMAKELCRCRTKNCRRHVRGFYDLPQKRRDEYASFLASHLLPIKVRLPQRVKIRRTMKK